MNFSTFHDSIDESEHSWTFVRLIFTFPWFQVICFIYYFCLIIRFAFNYDSIQSLLQSAISEMWLPCYYDYYMFHHHLNDIFATQFFPLVANVFSPQKRSHFFFLHRANAPAIFNTVSEHYFLADCLNFSNMKITPTRTQLFLYANVMFVQRKTKWADTAQKKNVEISVMVPESLYLIILNGKKTNIN